MGDFLLGLAVIPALAVVVGLGVLTRWFVVYRIQRLKGAHPRRRAQFAARLYASRRAWVWSTYRVAVAVTVGCHWDVKSRAEAVLLDEFVPLSESAEEVV